MLTAGTMVQGGYYLNRDKLDLIAIGGKEGLLPGDVGERYIRLPVWAVILLAPMAGGMFAMLMPAVGFAVVFHHLLLGRKKKGSAATATSSDA